MNKRVLICGSRNYTNVELIRTWLSKLQDWGYDTLIEGEAQGADSIARDEAKKINFNVLKYPANWEKYGRRAGPVRNTQMLVEGEPGLVVAFSNDIKNSRGTLNMVTQARKRKIEVIIVEE